MKSFDCPDCLMIQNENINVCDMCIRNRLYYKYTITPNIITIPEDAKDYDPCEKCSNNPQNGGSGICHCTIPYFSGKYRITCLTSI